MSLPESLIKEIEQAGAKFLYYRRPEPEIRHKLDLGWRLVNQDVFIFEIRPQWNKPKIIREHNIAKAHYVKTKDIWQVYWMRGNLEWDKYTPKPEVKNISEFFELVTDDKHCCFFG
jgi:hypothetical protein